MGLFMVTVHRTAWDRKKWCRICGRPVRSKFGNVCSRARCHRAAVRLGR